MTSSTNMRPKPMKLYVQQIPGDGVAGKSFRIVNEKGERLRGITSASVHHDMNDACRIDLLLVVNGVDIVMGDPPEQS